MRRFTRELAALVVVVALIALGFLLTPMVGGILAERAHNADQALLQSSVALYQESRIFPQPEWPTLSGSSGIPHEGAIDGYQCDDSDASEVCSWLAFELLTEQGDFTSTDLITSAETTLNVGATNAPSGTYGWYVDSEGLVNSVPRFSRDVRYP